MHGYVFWTEYYDRRYSLKDIIATFDLPRDKRVKIVSAASIIIELYGIKNILTIIIKKTSWEIYNFFFINKDEILYDLPVYSYYIFYLV